MPPPGDPAFTARTAFDDTIVAGEDARVRLEVVRDGVAVVWADPGDVELVDAGGTVLFSAAATVDGEGALVATIPALTTTDLPLAQLYQLRWSPTFGAETAPRRYRRQAVVARFRLMPPVADADLVVGNYPDLLDNLGGYRLAGAGGEVTLQPWIDEAWGWVLRELYRVERWPDLLVSTADVFEVTRQRAWFLIFRFLFRSNGGDGSRFERLMEDHGRGADKEWQRLTGRWDSDHDGVADSESREPAQTLIHRNAAPQMRLNRSARW
jgi:hypothetical protein